VSRALVFDFGGPVLLTPFELRSVGERALGLAPGTLAWTGPFDPAGDADWRAFQAGEMTERDYWARRVEDFAAITGLPASMPVMCSYLYSGEEAELVRPGAVALLRSAKDAGLPVGALTNDLTAFHDAEWVARMGVLREFDALVDGRTEGVYKPDPAAYRIVLDRMGVAAQDTVFLDDQPVNLAGAESVGMIPVHLDPTSPAEGFRVARSLLGLPEE
jgi:putative hydrolase of the HAD superfamily